MANIVISDLRPAGSELFSDSESYLRDLKEQEMMYTAGGAVAFSSFFNCCNARINEQKPAQQVAKFTIIKG